MRNAILATRLVVVDSLSMLQLHKVSLTVTLPPRALHREPNDDQTSHAFDTVPSETLPPNSSPNIESEAPAPVAPETLGAKKVKPKSNPEN